MDKDKGKKCQELRIEVNFNLKRSRSRSQTQLDGSRVNFSHEKSTHTFRQKQHPNQSRVAKDEVNSTKTKSTKRS